MDMHWDVNNDGVTDAYGTDANNDGYAEIQTADTNYDGVYDTLGQDSNQNGYFEILVVDSDNDGDADYTRLDMNENGVDDRVEPVTPATGPTMSGPVWASYSPSSAPGPLATTHNPGDDGGTSGMSFGAGAEITDGGDHRIGSVAMTPDGEVFDGTRYVPREDYP
jgi:hypothetical protein